MSHNNFGAAIVRISLALVYVEYSPLKVNASVLIHFFLPLLSLSPLAQFRLSHHPMVIKFKKEILVKVAEVIVSEHDSSDLN